MSPEAEEAPMDHIKVSHALKQELVVRLFNRNAFSEETAVPESDLNLVGQEKLALQKLILETEVKQLSRMDGDFFYLAEQYIPPKSYRKQVVIGLSYPLLIFLVAIIIAGFGAIIYGIFFGI